MYIISVANDIPRC